MAIEVFWGSGSGPAWRVLLALAVKKVPYESRLLSFSNKEHKTPEMLAMSPRGKVPFLRDGAFTTSESLAILWYLEKKFPTPALFGTSAEDTARVMRVIMDHECYGQTKLGAFSRPLLFGRLDTERDACVAAIGDAGAELATLEASLGDHPYLAGDTLSAADLFVFPTIATLVRALGKPGADSIDHPFSPLAGRFPRLAAWQSRVEGIDGYDATYPPHWR